LASRCRRCAASASAFWRAALASSDHVVELDVLLDVRRGLADLADDLAQPSRDLGQHLGSEENKRDREDDDHLAESEVEHNTFLAWGGEP
jgi:hypothetical protein